MKWIALLLLCLFGCGGYLVFNYIIDQPKDGHTSKAALIEKQTEGMISSEPYYEHDNTTLPELTMMPYVQEKLVHKKRDVINKETADVPTVSGDEIPPEAETVKIF